MYRYSVQATFNRKFSIPIICVSFPSLVTHTHAHTHTHTHIHTHTQPIQPSPITAEVSNGGESSDAVYQNAAAVAGTPPKRNLDSAVRYENVNPPSVSGPSDIEDSQEKKKPVARTRNSVRSRGGGPVDSAAVPALGQSPPRFELDGSGRGESLSPDPRNNAPSPKPKPRGKRNFPDNRSFDGNDNSAETRTPPPLPPAKPHSGTAPSTSGRRGPPEPPPKVPKTMVTDVSSSSLAGKKKPIPPPPRKESTPERHSGGALLSNKQSPTGGQDRTEVQASDLVTDEDPYSPIDRTQFTDTGPSIQVLDEKSGKTLPLDFVERELETVGEADTSKSSSILDAVSVYMYVCMCVCECVCTCTCMCVWVTCVCVYV